MANLGCGTPLQNRGARVNSFALKKSEATALSGVETRTERKHANAPIPVAVLGSVNSATKLYHDLLGHSITGSGQLRVNAIFADGMPKWLKSAAQEMVVNDTKWAESFVECCGIERVIVAIPQECDSQTTALVKKSARIFREVYIAPDITGQGVGLARIQIAKNQRLQIEVGASSDAGNSAPSENHFLKRLLDVVGVSVIGLMALPFLLVTAIAILLTSKGPLFFKQVRIGKGNRLFVALKFRTMFVDAADRLEHHLEADPVLHKQWETVHKLKNDPRVTVVGKFLRRFSLDELPQLWNVLVGDMSLIGPRPIVVSEIEKYGLDYAAYESVRPGLTGLWQVSGRNDTTYEERVALDAYYVRHWSLKLDASIMIRTLRAVVSGVGAY